MLGVALALLLHQNIVFRSLARSLILFPYFISTVVAVLVWRWLFNDLYGILNHVMMWTGLLSMPIDWLGQMPNAMISVILVGAWKYFPFVVISVLARLQTIPDHLYEAATMDGAGAWGRFCDITLPQLRDVLFIVILLRAIWDFKEFDLIYLLTGGGPVDLDPDAAAARLQAGLRAERDGRRLGGRRADDAGHAGLHDPVLPLRPARRRAER